MSTPTYYTLGKSGLRVSRLALGTMTFGNDWGWGSEEGAARAIFDRYLAAGGNFLDTADLYTGGNSERLLGRFVKDSGSRDRVVIASKYSFGEGPDAWGANPNAGGNGRKHLLRALEGSLQRLGTDYLDLYLMHVWDRVTPVEEVVRTLDDAVRAGKIRHYGFSDVPAWYAARAATLAELRGYERPVTLQMQYSLVERQIEREYVALGAETGQGLMVWSPLASGLLSGKYRPSESGGQGEGRLAMLAGSGNPAFADKFSARNWAIVAELEKVAKELGRSMAQVALNWVATQPGVGSVVLGATKLSQLDDNLGALDFEIPAELRARLEAVSAPEPQFPYYFFEPAMQGMVHSGAAVGDKPASYARPVAPVANAGAGVQ